MKELKRLLMEDVVTPVREPEISEEYGLTVPNGVLLCGPPGCGKTYIAEKLAEELGWNYMHIVGSEVGSPYIHGTGLKIAEKFREAEENGPTVLFIDEIEGLVPSRSGLGGSQDHRVEEVNEFLTQLNNAASRGILVVAATNEPDGIDKAAVRSGRIDKIVYVGSPDEEAREDLLRFHLQGRRCDKDNISLREIAKKIEGYSCADIKLLVDEAARIAFKERKSISQIHLNLAVKRVPPSVPREVEEEYSGFMTRGAGETNNAGISERGSLGFGAIYKARQMQLCQSS